MAHPLDTKDFCRIINDKESSGKMGQGLAHAIHRRDESSHNSSDVDTSFDLDQDLGGARCSSPQSEKANIKQDISSWPRYHKY